MTRKKLHEIYPKYITDQLSPEQFGRLEKGAFLRRCVNCHGYFTVEKVETLLPCPFCDKENGFVSCHKTHERKVVCDPPTPENSQDKPKNG